MVRKTLKKTLKRSLAVRKTLRRPARKQPSKKAVRQSSKQTAKQPSKKTMKPVKKASRAPVKQKPFKTIKHPSSSQTPYVPLLDDVEIKSYLEASITGVCAYCKHRFAKNEVAIEKEIHGRTWRFCSDACYADFMDAVHFQDEDKDSYGNMTVTGQRDEL
jgi:hypothetical protein